MKLTILAFGIAKEIFGGSSVRLEVNDACSVHELQKFLQEKFPRLNELSSFLIAVNNHYALPGELISEKDEIAVIPPVSGG
ncbi:MAG: MoaD/ThiS family protein [Chitinophagaceae bacterium]|nr:MoaD/ThiS family protein [Chitinophagaceae bacterium]